MLHHGDFIFLIKMNKFILISIFFRIMNAMNKTIKNIKTHLGTWKSDNKATASIEYALMVTAVAMSIFATVFFFGEDIAEFYNSLGDLIS